MEEQMETIKTIIEIFCFCMAIVMFILSYIIYRINLVKNNILKLEKGKAVISGYDLNTGEVFARLLDDKDKTEFKVNYHFDKQEIEEKLPIDKIIEVYYRKEKILDVFSLDMFLVEESPIENLHSLYLFVLFLALTLLAIGFALITF